jgi:hypothetical protein
MVRSLRTTSLDENPVAEPQKGRRGESGAFPDWRNRRCWRSRGALALAPQRLGVEWDNMATSSQEPFAEAAEWLRRLALLFAAAGLVALWWSLGYEGLVGPSEEVGSPFAVRSASQWRWQPRRVWPGGSSDDYWVRGLRKTHELFSITSTLAAEPASGSVLQVKPGTETAPVAIASLFGSVRLFAEGGDARFRLGPGLAKLSDGAVATVVRRALRDEWEFTLYRGTASLGLGGRDVDVREGDTLRFLGTGKSGKYALRSVRRLPFLPRYPAANARILYSPPLESIDFTWEGEVAPAIEIDKDPSFSAPMRVSTNGGRSARAALAVGKYYWRLRADDAQSPVAAVSIVPRIRYSLSVVPPEKGQGNRVILRWEPIPWADRYRVEVAKDPRFEKNVQRAMLTEAQWTFRPKEGGVHFWRVQAMNAEWGDWAFSEPMKFVAKRVPAPVLRATSTKSGAVQEAPAEAASSTAFPMDGDSP